MQGQVILRTLRPLRYCLGLVPALAIVIWMGLDSGSSRYDRSPGEVRGALMGAHVPTHILGDTVSGSRVRREGENTVITALLDPSGREIMHFVTTIVPDGDGSQVSTEVHAAPGPAEPNGREAFGKNGFARAMLDKLAQEHVAAAIEERPFDMMFAAPPGAKQMIGMSPDMKDKIDNANASASEIAKYQQEAQAAHRQQQFRERYGENWGDSGFDDTGDWGN